MHQGRWIAAAVGLTAALALAAPAGATVKAAASDKAILRAGVIASADVPSTWTAGKQTDSGTKYFKGIAACKQIVAATDLARRGPRALSPQFTDPASPMGTTLAEDGVYAFKTVKGAQRLLSPFEASNATTCYEQSLNKALGGKAQITMAPISTLQGVGDQSVGFEANITVTDQTGTPVPLIADVIFVRVGRALVGFDFINKDAALPRGPSIVNTVVSRLTSTVNG